MHAIFAANIETMNILQQPDALSLSMNLKKFVLNADAQVSFVLKKGEVEILSQRYDPDSNGRIEIDVRDIVHAQLAYLLKEEALPYEQTGLAALFKATIDEQEVSFIAVRGGVDRLADTATNFLTQNWLTWQPTVKPVTYYSPEFLTYYAVKSGVVKLKATLTDESSQSVDLAQLEAGKAYTIPVQYSTIVGKLGDKKPAYYDVWVEDAEGQRLTYIQRYYADSMRSISEDWVLFENSLGGLDCFRAYGATNLEAEHTHNLAEIDEVSEEYRVDTERKYQKNTGHLGKDEARWLLDFFPSQRKYIYTGSYLRQIVVVESDVTGNLRELPASYTFTYKYADARPLLNLPRTDVPADMLDITIPDIGNFTIPPRLAEVPRLPLSEGDLFPVQNPYSENWGTTTLGAIAEIIGQLLSTIAGGGGGVGHTHGNIELLNALSYVNEYLLVNGKKIKAGYADLAGDVEGEKYLHKDQPDSTSFLQTFLGGLNVGEFIDSMLAGKGIGLFPDGRAQLSRLEVRESLSVLEIIFNRLSAMESDYSFSESGTVESVTQMEDGTYTLKLRKRWENDFTALQENDIIYGVVNNLASGSGEYYTSWARVLSVDTPANSINVVLYPDSEVPGGKNYPPVELMAITRRGNPVNEDRQSWWYLSSREGCICMLDGVTKPVLEESNYSVIVGKLKHLSIFDNLPINYRQSYVYCRGIAAQDVMRIDYQGNPIRQENQRGLWSAEEAVSNPYQSTQEVYDSVYHYGCKWMCLLTGTTQEPRYGCTDWAMIEGNPKFTIDMKSSNGWYFDAEKFVTTLSITGMLYNRDVTEHILDEDVSWTRDTGNVTEDNAWAAAHAESGKVLPLTLTDLGPDYMNLSGCKFIAKAILRDGQENMVTENYVTF